MTRSEIARPVTRAASQLASFCVALALFGSAPAPLEAQWGIAGGVRVMTVYRESASNSQRAGFEGRVYYDRDLTRRFGVRGEMAYTQMQFIRDLTTVKVKVSENGFEFLAIVRSQILFGPLTGAYAQAAPVASWRSACGVGRHDLNGRVACDEGETFLVGWMLGGGYRWPLEGGTDLTLDLRYFGNVTAAAGGQLVAISLGVRGR